MYRTSVTANMNLIGVQFFWYRYRIVIVCSVTGALRSTTATSTTPQRWLKCDVNFSI